MSSWSALLTSAAEVSFNNLRFRDDGIHIIGPPLQHFLPLLSKFGAIVDTLDPFLLVAERFLNPLGAEAVFSQFGRRRSALIVYCERFHIKGQAF